eukprot:403349344
MKYDCFSFGEGAPGIEPPQFLEQELVRGVRQGFNQYVRPSGNLMLVKQIANIYGQKLKREINPMTEIMVSNGANASLFILMQALVNKGEEVVVFEPYFPPYLEHIEYAQGVVKTCPLEMNDQGKYVFNPDLFRKALSKKTKVLILNNCHNPTGKIFTREELEIISDILDKEFPDVYVISDEVYEFLNFESQPYNYFANIRNNFRKTFSVFSGGKLFCATGWKVGWTIAPADILKPAHLISNTVYYGFNSPGQYAVARSLTTAQQPDFYEGGLNYIESLQYQFKATRDYLYDQLQNHSDIPFKCILPQSGYFMMIDISKTKSMIPEKYLQSHDYEEDLDSKLNRNKVYMPNGKIPLDLAFSRWLALERGIISMPGSLFYHIDSQYKNDNYVRFAICRGMDKTQAGIKRLQQGLRAIRKI